jgi:hypothetical protein
MPICCPPSPQASSIARTSSNGFSAEALALVLEMASTGDPLADAVLTELTGASGPDRAALDQGIRYGLASLASHVHLNGAGYAATADVLFFDLINAYEDWKRSATLASEEARVVKSVRFSSAGVKLAGDLSLPLCRIRF